MGWLKKLKKTFKRLDKQITGGRVTREIKNAGKAIAPLAKPVLTVAGAVLAGPAGAAAGAAIGEPTGNVLGSGKLTPPTPKVDVDLTLHVVGAPGEGGATLSEYDPAAGGAVSSVSTGAPAQALSASPADDDIEPSWSSLFLDLLTGALRNIHEGIHLDAPPPPPGAAGLATSVATPIDPLAVSASEAKYTVNQNGIAVLDGYKYANQVTAFRNGTAILSADAIKRK